MTYVIGEVGSNFNGSFDTAVQYVKTAKSCGCDAVKFQLFEASHIAQSSFGQEFDLIKSLELNREWLFDLKKVADVVGIDLLASPFDVGAVNDLCAIDVPLVKIASSEIRNFNLLAAIAETGKPVLMSTGMAELSDISRAVELLSQLNSGSLSLLHCRSVYPLPVEDANLNALHTLKAAFGLPVGFSDHSMGILLPVAAVSMGASIIEKHITLDRTAPGPDHFYAIEPDELSLMIANIRAVELALGDGRISINGWELENCRISSFHFTKPLSAGCTIEKEDVELRRPGTGIRKDFGDLLIGRRLRCSVEKGTTAKWDHVEIP